MRAAWISWILFRAGEIGDDLVQVLIAAGRRRYSEWASPAVSFTRRRDIFFPYPRPRNPLQIFSADG